MEAVAHDRSLGEPLDGGLRPGELIVCLSRHQGCPGQGGHQQNRGESWNTDHETASLKCHSS
jgi:hypothetical protein